MRSFETFDHTADIGLIARGRTLKGLFANAAAGLVDLMVDPIGLLEETSATVTVSAADREALLVAWLNELLFAYSPESASGAPPSKPNSRLPSWNTWRTTMPPTGPSSGQVCGPSPRESRYGHYAT